MTKLMQILDTPLTLGHVLGYMIGTLIVRIFL